MKLLITGEGRSGTKWLATLLKESGYEAGHETGLAGSSHLRKPWRTADVSWRRGKLPNPGLVRDAIDDAPDAWIEVDGNWLFYAPTFLALDVPVLHLVRDGRDVVRSFMARRRRGAFFDAPEGLEYFGKLCWRWNYKVLWLANLNLSFLRLEDAVGDYSALCKALESFDCAPERKAWEALRKKHINASEAHTMPVYGKWPKKDKRTFWQLCSLAMGRYGYGGRYPYN